MSQDDVRARVEAFVSDFHRGWERAGKPPSSLIFDQAPVEAWAGELAVLVGAHFTTGASTGEEGVLSGRAAHDPSLEIITEVKVEADRATVCSAVDNGSVSTYYEYRLVRDDERWRICQLLRFLDPPGVPLVDAAVAEAMLNSASLDAELSELPSHLELDVAGLFAEGRQVAPFGETVSLRVVHLGEVTCGSGVLTVRDFGYGDFALAPLAAGCAPAPIVSRSPQSQARTSLCACSSPRRRRSVGILPRWPGDRTSSGWMPATWRSSISRRS